VGSKIKHLDCIRDRTSTESIAQVTVYPFVWSLFRRTYVFLWKSTIPRLPTWTAPMHLVSLHRGVWWWLHTGSMLCYLVVYCSCSRSYALTNCWHTCKKRGSTMILLTCEVKVLFLVENCFYIHQMMHSEARDVHSSVLRRICSCTAGVIWLCSICNFVTGACHHIMNSGKVVWAWNIQPCKVTPKEKLQNF